MLTTIGVAALNMLFDDRAFRKVAPIPNVHGREVAESKT